MAKVVPLRYIRSAAGVRSARRAPNRHFDVEIEAMAKTKITSKKAALWRFRVILTVAAFALAGCNANQAINPSGQADRCANDADCNPYDPASYAQNQTGR